jgi:ADP-ribosylation factor related protein 1
LGAAALGRGGAVALGGPAARAWLGPRARGQGARTRGAMFSLLSGFFKWLFEKKEIQILIVGLDHAGKTTLLEQMKGQFQKSAHTIPLDKIPPTVGLNIGRMDINNVRVIFWDLGGQAALRSIWDKYYSEAHGLVFVLDSADAARFEEAQAAMESLVNHPELAGVPLLVCANKMDLAQARSVEEIADYFELGDGLEGADSAHRASPIARRRESRLQPVSALTCAGIEEGVTWLVERAANNPEIIRARGPP